jgi:arylsulfatase A-like enzyme
MRGVGVALWLCACQGAAPADPTKDTDAAVDTDVVSDTDPAPDTDRADLVPGGNVMVVLADDLGVDVVRSYGLHPDAPPTPNLDALAAQGVRFTHAYAFPSCSPTRAAILTGRTARRTGVGRTVESDLDEVAELPLSEVILPEVLATQGYASSAVGKWHLGTLSSPDGPRHPLDSGFGWYAGPFSNLGRVTVGGIPLPGSYWLWEKDNNGTISTSRRYVLTDEVDDAIARAQAMPEPWFLWVALTAPHAPLHVPPDALTTLRPTVRSSDADKYRAMVEAMDTELGRLLASLSPAVRARTTVVVMGDNGTPDEATLPPFDSQGAKASLHEGGTRVPLIVSGPGVAVGVSDGLVQALDLFPTVLDLAGVPRDTPLLQGVAVDGVSLLPALRDPSVVLHDDIVTEQFAPNGPGPWLHDDRSVRDTRWRVIESAAGDLVLYDVAAAGDVQDGPDLLAAGPLSPDAADALARLQARLDAWAVDVGAPPVITGP